MCYAGLMTGGSHLLVSSNISYREISKLIGERIVRVNMLKEERL